MIYFPLLFLFILLIFLLSNLTTSKKFLHKIFNNSPLECGFNIFLKKRSAFSYSFFNFIIMFLTLELEIILIIPFTINFWKNHFLFSNFFLLIILILLFIFMEWKIKMINWNK